MLALKGLTRLGNYRRAAYKRPRANCLMRQILEAEDSVGALVIGQQEANGSRPAIVRFDRMRGRSMADDVGCAASKDIRREIR